jgi:hypothetical protein
MTAYRNLPAQGKGPAALEGLDVYSPTYDRLSSNAPLYLLLSIEIQETLTS